ncbi:MAG: phenylalanine--tRNA ligase subunit alpha [Pseudomonadota bacterium]
MSIPTITNADVQALVDQGLAGITTAATTQALQDIRVQYLGKSGSLSAHPYFQTIKTATPDEKKIIGADRTAATAALTAALDARKGALEVAELNARLARETVDVTLPATPASRGSIHPITQVTEELIAIFADFGFTVAEGPEIEDDFHNFSALNIPESHPARQMHDTFYLRGDGNEPYPVLRTHTSPVQVRTMVSEKPPIRIIAPGTTYRSDSDMTHTPMFHQIEGLVIEKNVHMGHLKGLLHDALAAFFGLETLPMRFRASFFPFTEPSAEVDIGCKRGRDALVIGEGSDWLEVAGCGMVHPSVLRNCGLDPAEWQGFAFGCGIERLAMLKYNIPDLRTMFAGDVRWLKHYGFNALDIPSLIKGVAA